LDLPTGKGRLKPVVFSSLLNPAINGGAIGFKSNIDFLAGLGSGIVTPAFKPEVNVRTKTWALAQLIINIFVR
jgi:hypothetical protein